MKEIFEIVQNEKIVDKIVNKHYYSSSYKEDIKQELYLEIALVGEEKLKKLQAKNQLLPYISGLCYRALSSTGRIGSFYKNLNKEESLENQLNKISYEQKNI